MKNETMYFNDLLSIWLEKQKQEQLEHYLTAHTGVSEAVIYLGLYTGLRVGELCALRWENIHFSDRYLHVGTRLPPAVSQIAWIPKRSAKFWDTPI